MGLHTGNLWGNIQGTYMVTYRVITEYIQGT